MLESPETVAPTRLPTPVRAKEYASGHTWTHTCTWPSLVRRHRHSNLFVDLFLLAMVRLPVISIRCHKHHDMTRDTQMHILI